MNVETDESSESLMTRYRSGDSSAFEALYQRISPRTYGYLRQRLQRTDAVDEVFQAVFMKLHRARDQYEDGKPFLPWFFSICHSTLIDFTRSESRQPVSVESEELEAVPAEELRPAGAISVEGLRELPETQRRALELRYQEDRSFEEIGREIGTSAQNARQLVSRAVRKLRTLVGKERLS